MGPAPITSAFSSAEMPARSAAWAPMQSISTKRQLLDWYTIRFQEFVDWNGELLAHAAVDMHTEHLHTRAAIALATAAGDTFAAIQIRNDAALIADGVIQRAISGADLEDFNREPVAHDARIAEKILLPAECMQISAADAHALDLHQRLVPSGIGRFSDLLQAQLKGFFKYDCFQSIYSRNPS